MRILYLSQYFPPEVGATQTRAYEMAHALIEQGHSVTILTEFPNHPSGIIPLSYRGKLYEKQNLDGIEVRRVFVLTSTRKSFGVRLGLYGSYAIGATIAGVLVERKPFDMIYATSPPLFSGAAGLAISYLRRIPFVFEVRDLWPESAIALGELRNATAIHWATQLELACYHRAQKIIVVSKGIRKNIVKRNIPEEKIALVENGANTELFHFHPLERERLRSEFGYSDRFICIYAGILGLAQGLETILEAARLLKGDPVFHFILLGEGPKKADLMLLKEKLELSNVTFMQEVPREEVPKLLSMADTAVVPLKKRTVFQGAIPSKMFDAWACELPVILSAEGEAQELLEKAQAGICVPPENPYEVAKALITLRNNSDERIRMGKRGREFTKQYYSRQALAQRLIHILQNTLKSQ